MSHILAQHFAEISLSVKPINNMTTEEQELKQWICERLPKTISCKDYGIYFWLPTYEDELRDTELLHLCSLVEEKLSDDQLCDVATLLCLENRHIDQLIPAIMRATWQQRARALRKVLI